MNERLLAWATNYVTGEIERDGSTVLYTRRIPQNDSSSGEQWEDVQFYFSDPQKCLKERWYNGLDMETFNESVVHKPRPLVTHLLAYSMIIAPFAPYVLADVMGWNEYKITVIAIGAAASLFGLKQARSLLENYNHNKIAWEKHNEMLNSPSI